jgi:hypothetical protein
MSAQGLINARERFRRIMPGKSPPFKRRVKDALDAAKETGFSRVRYDPKSGKFEFFKTDETDPDDLNDFDAKPPRDGK